MLIKCIAVDDEPLALELLQQYIAQFPALRLVQTFSDAIAAAEFLKNSPIDLLFIDINMPDITGIELVRSMEKKPMIIFTTAYKQFAVEGFELEAIDYLLKPIELNRFKRAVEKAIDYYNYKKATKAEKQESIFVRSEYQMVKVDLNEIEYIESLEDYLKIHRTNDRPVMTLMTLKAILEKLPPDQFQRIHRSYVIPLAKVKSIVNRKVRLTTAELPISDSYAGFISSWMNKN
ncbi:MAG: response regulator transcription factor [Flavisolibacter sp.]|nr:response regulator transcription factor [Flavisolibacter sp.]